MNQHMRISTAVQPQPEVVGQRDGVDAHVMRWEFLQALQPPLHEILHGTFRAQYLFEVGGGELNEGLEKIPCWGAASADVPQSLEDLM